jgi:cytoskeletal protein RodZ
MGELGQYLREARAARGLDLREAAQLTRISVQYLKALEEEDFAKLPGEIFVTGFLKNYGKFLRLDEAELMKRYGELRRKPSASGAAVQAQAPAETAKRPGPAKFPLEPFAWGAGIVVILVLFLFVALPERQPVQNDLQEAAPAAVVSEPSSTAVSTDAPEKLYLEVEALEDTWLLVRTDDGPQKKALLKKDERLIWSATERFSLSYGSAGAIRLLLNGRELTVNEPRDALIRDMLVTAEGIVDRTVQHAAPPQPKRRQPVPPQPSPAAEAPAGGQQHMPPPLPQKREASSVPPASRPTVTPAREQQRTIAPPAAPEAPVEKPKEPAAAAPQKPSQ